MSVRSVIIGFCHNRDISTIWPLYCEYWDYNVWNFGHYRYKYISWPLSCVCVEYHERIWPLRGFIHDLADIL